MIIVISFSSYFKSSYCELEIFAYVSPEALDVAIDDHADGVTVT